jgi:hypothetical protein
MIHPSIGILAGSPEGSISKMSDTASRLSAFESRFDSVIQLLSSALQLLQDQSTQQAQAQRDLFTLMSRLLPPAMPQVIAQPLPREHNTTNNTDNMNVFVIQTDSLLAAPDTLGEPPEGIQQNASPSPANQPNQEQSTGGSPEGGTAGQG